LGCNTGLFVLNTLMKISHRKIRKVAYLPLILAGFALGTGCAVFTRGTAPEADVFIRPTGTVIKVDPHQHFVVFESPFRFRAEQHVFAIRNERRVARLVVHEQSRPPFYVADIIEGRPEVDDLIE
jgi:hypothetical protein